MTRLELWVPGRPAPKGSKERGANDQLLEVSKYLPAWMRAIKKATYQQYKEMGVKPEELPYFRGPVAFACFFHLDTGQRIDSPPDLDKLLRAVWDALTQARVWEDDGRVTKVHDLEKVQVEPDCETGAWIHLWGTRG